MVKSRPHSTTAIYGAIAGIGGFVIRDFQKHGGGEHTSPQHAFGFGTGVFAQAALVMLPAQDAVEPASSDDQDLEACVVEGSQLYRDAVEDSADHAGTPPASILSAEETEGTRSSWGHLQKSRRILSGSFRAPLLPETIHDGVVQEPGLPQPLWRVVYDEVRKSLTISCSAWAAGIQIDR